MSATLVLAVLAVIAVAVLVRSVWGFGDAMLALPLLSLLIGLEQGAPLMVLLSAVIAAQLLRERPELVQLRRIVGLLAGAALGVPLGLLLLVSLPVAVAHAILGALLVGFAGWSLGGRRTPGRSRGRGGATDRATDRATNRATDLATNRATNRATDLAMDLAFGALAGASSAAFDIAGPPLLIYAVARGWSADELRVNLQAVFLPLSLLTLGAHAAAGLWTREVLVLALVALPVVAAGLWVGPRVRRRVEGGGGERVVYALILVLGCVELLRAALSA